jgi:hypothetical protein
MTPSFKTKLLAVAFVPALTLAAGAAVGMGNQTTNPSSASKATAPTTSGSMQNSMKTGTASADATFDRLDKNHDGKLSSTEGAADSKLQAMWKKVDSNNDGTVTKAEFEAHASDLK